LKSKLVGVPFSSELQGGREQENEKCRLFSGEDEEGWSRKSLSTVLKDESAVSLPPRVNENREKWAS